MALPESRHDVRRHERLGDTATSCRVIVTLVLLERATVAVEAGREVPARRGAVRPSVPVRQRRRGPRTSHVVSQQRSYESDQLAWQLWSFLNLVLVE